MCKSILAALIILLSLSLTSPVNAEVYKWTDKNGRIHFTDSPPQGTKTDKIDVTPRNTYRSPSQEQIQETLSRSTGVSARKAKVIMYSTTWCGVCKKAKRWFNKNNIAFREYDTEKSERGRRDYKKMNGRGVPIIKIGKQRFNGFSPSRLTPVLRKAGHKI